MSTKVTIIVPVYGDWSSLEECVDSLLEHVDTLSHKLMFVNDCGPEAEAIEAKLKAKIHRQKNVYYFRNKRNLGFLKNCNNAVMNLDKTNNDILLLNSDTKVTEGFLAELLGVLHDDKAIGAVSPRSNNATIATVPLSAIHQKGIEPEKSYALFRKKYHQLPRYNEVPTAHGFCMLIKRSLIKKYGLFDEVFGKGYGEEVDFCQRISQHGYKSVLANWAYVFHQEARSFSFEKKAALLEQNNKIIRKRYPEYQKQVRDYIEGALRAESILLDSKITRSIKSMCSSALRLMSRLKSRV